MQDKAKNNTISNVSNISVWLSNKLSGNGMHCNSVDSSHIAQNMVARARKLVPGESLGCEKKFEFGFVF